MFNFLCSSFLKRVAFPASICVVPAVAPASPAEKHLPLDPSSYGENTPRKRVSESQLWKFVKRYKLDKPKGITHVCTYPMIIDGNDAVCNTYLKLYKRKNNGPWMTTGGVDHNMSKAHPDSQIAKKSKELSDKNKKQRALVMTKFGLGLGNRLSNKDKEIASQIRFLIYSRGKIRKRVFECPYFKQMMMTANKNIAVVSKYQVKKYVEAE